MRRKQIKYFASLIIMLACAFAGIIPAYAFDPVTINITDPVENGTRGMYSGTITISIPEGTYVYANPKGPGIGKAAVITLKLPAGMKASQIEYPAGEKYTPEGFDEHVFIWKKSAKIRFTIAAGKSVKPGRHKVIMNINLLQCSDACLPYDKNFELILEVKGRSGIKAEIDDASLYDDNSETKKSSATLTDDQKKIIDRLNISPYHAGKVVKDILEAILFGILAGLILNLMPCVLPVVSLKIMALVRHGSAGSSARRHGLVFSAGIVSSFMILAGLAAFSGYKWGGLFQERAFIIGMSVFVFAMALSLFGVFIINVPGFAGRAASKHGTDSYSDSFVKGMLATLLATPCSGPFLGGILAWVFIQPVYVIFLVFSSVGFGMALPYIIVALKPGLARFIPRPGDWMQTMEEAMGFLLLFTSVYLLSLLDRNTAISTILLMVFVAIGLWQLGRFGSMEKTRQARLASLLALVSIVTLGIIVSFIFFAPQHGHSRPVPFSIQELMANKNSGKVTVVNFTADWCPNCKLVEKTALGADEVQKLLRESDIVFMTADITEKNTAAEYFMSKLGSSSIPFLAVFPAGKNFASPVCLRDIYSADDVIEAIRLARKKR